MSRDGINAQYVNNGFRAMSNLVSKRTLVLFRAGLRCKHKLQGMVKDVRKLPPDKRRKVNREVIQSIEDHNRWVKNYLKKIENVMVIKKSSEGRWI